MLSVAAAGEKSPLGIRPFETYTLRRGAVCMRLAAAPVVAEASATVQTVLQLAEFERNMESRITFDVEDRPVYRLRILLPDGFSTRSRLGARRVPICRDETRQASAADDLPRGRSAGQRAGGDQRAAWP